MTAMPEKSPRVVQIGNEVFLWVEQDSSVMLKTSEPHGDPVELTKQEARHLAKTLQQFADQIDVDDTTKNR